MLNDADDESPKDVEEAPVKNNMSLSSTNAVMQKSAVAELLSPALIQKVMRDEPRRRSSNGAIAPWGCEWWGVGNEAYGEWQLGYVPIRGFLWKHRRFARAMKRVSPSIQVIAVGAQHVAATDSTNRSRGDEQQQVVSLDAKGRYGFDVSWTGRVMREVGVCWASQFHIIPRCSPRSFFSLFLGCTNGHLVDTAVDFRTLCHPSPAVRVIEGSQKDSGGADGGGDL